MDQPPTFLHNIPSIHEKHQEIPAVFENLDLNRGIAAGDPLDYDLVSHSKAVAMALKGYRNSGNALVTADMVKTASSRAVAVEAAYAAVEYTPQNVAHALQQINHALQQINNRLENIEDSLQNIDGRVKVGIAQTANIRIVSRNTRLQAPLQLLPLQKTVGGYGRNLAVALYNVLDAPGRQVFHGQFPANGEAAEVGDAPPNFNPRIEGYRHMDILRMIVFYNENFEIAAQDDLPERIHKFRRFLAEF